MEPTANNSTRNWIIIAVIIIILIGIVWAVKGNSPTVINNYDFGNATGTSATGTNSNGAGAGANTGTGANGGSASVASNSLINNDASLKSLIDNLRVRIPETGVDIALARGVGTVTANNQKYTLTSGPIIGKAKTEDGYDVFVDMTLTKNSVTANVSTKTASNDKYVVSYHVLNDVVLFKSAVLIGTNVQIQGVVANADKSISVSGSQTVMNSAKGYILTVNYLDRKNGEPVTTAPSVSKTMVLNVKNHIVTK